MLPKARGLDLDFEKLGQRMLARKKELLTNGIPSDAEHHMVAKAGRNGDSPAATSKRRKTMSVPRPKTATARTRKATR